MYSHLFRFRRELSRLTLSPARIVRVVPNRICSMAVHPTENELLLAVGDKWGNLGVCSHLFIYLSVGGYLAMLSVTQPIFNQMLG
jgi:hypothetical protein